MLKTTASEQLVGTGGVKLNSHILVNKITKIIFSWRSLCKVIFLHLTWATNNKGLWCLY